MFCSSHKHAGVTGTAATLQKMGAGRQIVMRGVPQAETKGCFELSEGFVEILLIRSSAIGKEMALVETASGVTHLSNAFSGRS
jgi:hypothetical protein